MRNCTCPNCNAALSFSDDRDFGFCEYCGTKILLDDYRSTQRIIDEAKIRQVEAEKEIRLKELALQESRYNQQAKETKHSKATRKILLYIWIIVFLLLTVLTILLFVIGDTMQQGMGALILLYFDLPIMIGGPILLFKVIPDKEAEREMLKNGGIRFPKSLIPFYDKDVETVRTTLLHAGFENITIINKHDIRIGLFQKPNLVESISVAGERIQSGGKVYMPETPIVITYHGR